MAPTEGLEYGVYLRHPTRRTPRKPPPMTTPRSATLQLLLASSCISAVAYGQANCLFNETFEAEGLPSGWTMSPEVVERLDGSGAGTGQFTAPFTLGVAAQANATGYFPVPNVPAGNRFAMANDDAPPCDCAMDQIGLISPTIDLTTAVAPAVSFRFYHDGRPFNGRAWVDVSTNGSDWATLMELSEEVGAWQYTSIDLSSYVGGSIGLRFRYDDGDDWASGFALDDLCVFDRSPNDIALAEARLGDPGTSPFNTAARSLGYTMIPVEQQTALSTTLLLRNLGTTIAQNVTVEGTITLNGSGTQTASAVICSELLPLKDTLITWTPGWILDGTGTVELTLTISMTNSDDQVVDNTDVLRYRLTGPDEGGHAMGIDNDLGEEMIGGSDGFSAGCRFELIEEGTITGLSVRLGTGTLAGGGITALLTDGNLNVLTQSTEYTVTEADIALSFAGGAVYLPFSSGYSFDEAQDVIALVRFEGDTGAVTVASGGDVPTGAAYRFNETGLNVTYPTRAPIVRIHLSEPATGIMTNRAGSGTVHVYPNPTNGGTMLELPLSHGQDRIVQLFDAQGRSLGGPVTIPAGKRAHWLDLSPCTAGVWMIRVVSDEQVDLLRLIVE